MCAIFGFSGPQNSRLVRRMAEIVRHRGPDGDGFLETEGFSMGMCRLSIIDLEHGQQPIYNEDKSLAVCCNGEIYNYVELTEKLKAAGHLFTTHSDTEVIVHAYEEWGTDCVDHFNGMFAFCIYDLRNKTAFLARDRAGQKPLYYYHKNGRFVFGSEIKAILEADCVERACNLSAIDAYLGLRYGPQPETLFQDIMVLPGGHRMKWAGNDLKIDRYWNIELAPIERRSDDDYREEFEEIFLDAVRLTMRSDVPVGAYLSGGVDSSLVVAAAARETSKLNTFSIGFNSPIDETGQARSLSQQLGTNHHEVFVGPENFDELPKAIWHLERPIGDILILAYYKLAQETGRHVKVVLSGEGADELFAGYSFHKIIRWTEGYRRLVPGFVNRGLATPALDAVPVGLLNKLFRYPAYLGKAGKRKTVDYLRQYYRRNLAESYVALRALWDLEERSGIYADKHRALAREDWILPPGKEEGPFLSRLLKLQFDDWLQDNLLLRQDKNTMASSLELRVPFLDHRLIELAFRMPSNLKVRGLTDKFIERDLAKKLLPPENVKRSKNPFYFPIERFHEQKEIKHLLKLTLNPDQVRKRGIFDPEAVRNLVSRMEAGEFLYVKQVFSLVILELWHMIFIDKQQLW